MPSMHQAKKKLKFWKKLDFCFALQTWLHSWLDKYLEKEVEFIAQIASSYERRRLSFFFIPLKPVLLKKLVLKHHHPILTTIGFVASSQNSEDVASSRFWTFNSCQSFWFSCAWVNFITFNLQLKKLRIFLYDKVFDNRQTWNS